MAETEAKSLRPIVAVDKAQFFLYGVADFQPCDFVPPALKGDIDDGSVVQLFHLGNGLFQYIGDHQGGLHQTPPKKSVCVPSGRKSGCFSTPQFRAFCSNKWSSVALLIGRICSTISALVGSVKFMLCCCVVMK